MNFGFLKRRRAADATQVNQVSQIINRITEPPSEPIESNETPSERRRRLDYKRKARRRTLNKLQRALPSSRVESRLTRTALANTKQDAPVSNVPAALSPSNTTDLDCDVLKQQTSSSHSDTATIKSESSSAEHQCNLPCKIKTEPIDKTLHVEDHAQTASTTFKLEETPVVQGPHRSICDVKSESSVESSLFCQELLKDKPDKPKSPVPSQSVNGSGICDIPTVKAGLESQRHLNREIGFNPMNYNIPAVQPGGKLIIVKHSSLNFNEISSNAAQVAEVADNLAKGIPVTFMCRDLQNLVKKSPNDKDKVETNTNQAATPQVNTLKDKTVGQSTNTTQAATPQVDTLKDKTVGQSESIVVKPNADLPPVTSLAPMNPRNIGILNHPTKVDIAKNPPKVAIPRLPTKVAIPKNPTNVAIPKNPTNVATKQIVIPRQTYPVFVSFIGYDVNEVITVFTYQKLTKPLIVQLVDHLGNPCIVSGVMVHLSCNDGMQFRPDLQPTKSNYYGQVNYGTPTVFTTFRKRVANCPAKMCVSFCYGVFTVTSRSWHQGKEISGPSLRFHLQPNFSNPAKLIVRSDNSKCCNVGNMLKEFKVSAVAEDNRVLDIVTASQLSMKVWRVDRNNAVIYDVVVTPSLNEGDFYFNGVFTFKKRQAPTVAGMYNIQFSFQGQHCVITSNIMTINVLPEKPVMLIVDKPVGTPAVSNSKKSIHSRMIVDHLKVELADVYKNITHVDGMLSITLLCQHNHETPTFVGGTKHIQVPIVNGEVILAHILLEEKCRGIDGEEYLLRFEATSSDIPRPHVVRYDLPFFFYRGLTKQELLAKLTKEHETLVTSIKAYKELFETNVQLCDALQDNEKKLSTEVQKSSSELQNFGISDTSVDTLRKVDALLKKKQSRQEEILESQMNGNPSVISKNVDGLLGKVGYLASVADRNIAQILVWHLKDKLECMVTYTAAQAMAIQGSTGGLQDALSLDLVNQQQALAIWERQLPHVHMVGNFQPTGNPVAIRRHLVFSNDIGVCKVVFGALLGNTILIDTLKDAIRYRQEVVKRVSCPTILTKDGHRIQSDGTFCGLVNSSTSSKEQTDYLDFSAPQHHFSQQTLKCVIEHLKRHRSVLEQLSNAKHELAEYNRKNNTGITVKRDDYLQMESRLEKIGLQLENLKNSTIANDDRISNFEMSGKENPARNYERNLIDTIMCGLNIPEDDGHGEENNGESLHGCVSVFPS